MYVSWRVFRQFQSSFLGLQPALCVWQGKLRFVFSMDLTAGLVGVSN